MTYFIEMGRGHEPYTPALVSHRLSDLLQQLLLDFCRGELLRNSDQILHSEKTNGILVVTLEAAVYSETFVQDMLLRQFPNKVLGNSRNVR